jgi:hypothetical protein
MMKRNTDSVDRLREQDKQLEKDGLIQPFDRDVLFRSPTTLKYSGVPDGAGPPYPSRKAQRTALPDLKKG